MRDDALIVKHPYVRLMIGLAAAALLTYVVYDFVYLPRHRILPDEHRFIGSAIELTESGEFWARGKRAWEMPGMAVLYAAFYKVVGSKTGLVLLARVFQSLLLVVTALIVYRVGLYLYRDRAAALIAYGATLFYPFFIFYQAVITSETVFIVLLVAAFYWLYKWEHEGFRTDRFLVLATLAFGLAAYMKASLFILPPLLAAGFAFFAGRSFRRAWRALLVSSLVYGLCLSPWWFRNLQVLDHFVPFTTSSARNLYSGNNPMNRSGGGLRGTDWEPIGAYDTLPEIEWAEAYRQRAVAYIAQEPAVFLRMVVTKFGRFWRLYPYAEEWRQPVYMMVSIGSFGVVLLLAVIGVMMNHDMWRRLTPIYMLMVFFTLVHVVSISSVRYRLPLEPFLILLASSPAARAGRSMVERLRATRG